MRCSRVHIRQQRTIIFARTVQIDARWMQINDVIFTILSTFYVCLFIQAVSIIRVVERTRLKQILSWAMKISWAITVFRFIRVIWLLNLLVWNGCWVGRCEWFGQCESRCPSRTCETNFSTTRQDGWYLNGHDWRVVMTVLLELLNYFGYL